MSKINYRRKSWKIKAPVNKVNKIQIPDNIYDRNKQKKKWDKEIDEN